MDKKALMEELEQLGKLHQAGVFSQAEFDAEKSELMGRLRALRGGQTPMPSNLNVGGSGQVHGADMFATGFGGSQGSVVLGVGGVVGERYRLVRILGHGGMGEVWLAEDTRLGRGFALKFLAAELVGSSEALERIHREYEVLEKLTHPNIVRVFDMDQDKGSGRWYLRMEYVEGEDLGKKLTLASQQGQRPLFEMTQIVGWLGQLVEGLEYAHQRGILHRDIKPANLMLAAEGALKVMDFGIARVVSGTHVTQHTAMMGSMYYAAPELLRGQTATPAADIYSFGVLVYELLTGDLPVGRFALPSAAVAGVSKGVDAVIEQMLAMNPKHRGASLRDVWTALRDALLGRSAQVVVPPKIEPPPKIEVSAPSQAKVAEITAGTRRVFQVGGVDFPMRWIPAGRFQMGAGADDKDAFSNEKPKLEVTISRGFWMGETPVTQVQYQAIIRHNPSHFTASGLSAPVEQVSWYDAAAFANKLSALEGLPACFVGEGEKLDGMGNKSSDYLGCKGWRLPTEAEWEYACRAGTTTPRYGDLDKIAWYGKNSGSKTHSVGEKAANAWGLHDVLGNVWEWCYDGFGDYSVQAATDPVGAAISSYRVYRGGSWYDDARGARAAYRSRYTPSDRSLNLGFRLVRLSP